MILISVGGKPVSEIDFGEHGVDFFISEILMSLETLVV